MWSAIWNVSYIERPVKGHILKGLRQSEFDSLWRRANARNVSFSISVRWSIYIINSVDKPNFRVSLPHRRSTTVSSETNPLYLVEPVWPEAVLSVLRTCAFHLRTDQFSRPVLTNGKALKHGNFMLPFCRRAALAVWLLLLVRAIVSLLSGVVVAVAVVVTRSYTNLGYNSRPCYQNWHGPLTTLLQTSRFDLTLEIY